MAENTPELREWLMQTARHWMAAAMHEMELPEPVAPVATSRAASNLTRLSLLADQSKFRDFHLLGAIEARDRAGD
jgi:hypothetical protein